MAYAAYTTEAEFAAYLHRVLDRGGFASALGWTVIGQDYGDVTNEALRRYGTTDISTVTNHADIAALNAYGRAELWRQVMEATVHERDTRLADSSSAEMSQIHEHAREMRALAEADVELLGSGAVKVGITHLYPRHDPNRPLVP